HHSLLVGYFATIGWEVYAADLFSVAGSEGIPPLEQLSFDDLAELWGEAIAALGREAIVVGHGIGGLVALKLAEYAGLTAAVAIAPLTPGSRTPLTAQLANRLAAWRGQPLKPPTGKILYEFLADSDPVLRTQIVKSLIPGATA